MHDIGKNIVGVVLGCNNYKDSTRVCVLRTFFWLSGKSKGKTHHLGPLERKIGYWVSTGVEGGAWEPSTTQRLQIVGFVILLGKQPSGVFLARTHVSPLESI